MRLVVCLILFVVGLTSVASYGGVRPAQTQSREVVKAIDIITASSTSIIRKLLHENTQTPTPPSATQLETFDGLAVHSSTAIAVLALFASVCTSYFVEPDGLPAHQLTQRTVLHQALFRTEIAAQAP